jgi:RNA polymerase sigma factor (sigma-70 family)
VRHRALNVVRNQRKQFNLHARFAYDIADTTTARASSSDLPADETDLLIAVRAVIASLPERRRLAITLRWESGLGNADIAAVLGIAPQSVANLIQRALADIRVAFPNEFI